jgi:hypothetical protein
VIAGLDASDDDFHDNVINQLPVESRSDVQSHRERRSAQSPANDVVGIQFDRNRASGNRNTTGTIIFSINVVGTFKKNNFTSCLWK